MKWNKVLASVLFGLLVLSLMPQREIYNQKFSIAFRDRGGKLLRITLSGDEKYRVFVPINEISQNYIDSVIEKEDRYFRYHPGFNPISLVRAFYSTYVLKSQRLGASTITMQLVRLVYPLGTRTWAGKMEQLIRAVQLEMTHSKDQILEAYLNLVPFGGNIEGVGAASLIYFNKQALKLSAAESADLVRIPQWPKRAAFLNAGSQSRRLPFHAPHLTEYLKSQFNLRGEVATTLDLEIQKKADGILKHYLDAKRAWGVTNGAILIADLNKMDVLAYIGSGDFNKNEISGQIDGTRVVRSPGSTLKPFLYGLALDQGLIHPRTLLRDTPRSFGSFDPENFDREFLGPVKADEALVYSRNVPAVWLFSKLSENSFYDILKTKTSIKVRDPEHYGMSLPLGGIEFSLQDLVKMYGGLANLGMYRSLRFLKSENNQSSEKILSPEASYLVLQMLKKNPRTEGGNMEKLFPTQWPVAWKTGTSQSFRDAWTIGIAGKYIIGVWFGDFDRKVNAAYVGRDLAAPVFFQVVDYLRPTMGDGTAWQDSSNLNIQEVDTCTLSGQIAGPHCQHSKEKTKIISGVSPIEKCQVHQLWKVSKSSGKRLCAGIREETIDEVVEVWPTDILALLKAAGIPKRRTPLMDSRCEFQGITNNDALEMQSPRQGLQYQLTFSGKVGTTKIPFKANSFSDAKKLFWFVNNDFVAETETGGVHIWEATKPGKYQVSVVDQYGNTKAAKFEVQLATQ